jgi:hypothetical protein
LTDPLYKISPASGGVSGRLARPKNTASGLGRGRLIFAYVRLTSITSFHKGVEVFMDESKITQVLSVKFENFSLASADNQKGRPAGPLRRRLNPEKPEPGIKIRPK